MGSSPSAPIPKSVCVWSSGTSPAMSGAHALFISSFKHPQADAQRTLFTQQMLVRGFLAGIGLIRRWRTPRRRSDFIWRRRMKRFGGFGEAIKADAVMERLRGPVAHSGFKRLL